MILHTASEGITFSKQLENDSADFYEKLARQNTGNADIFLAFAKENKLKKCFMITRDIEEKEIHDGIEVEMIPLWKVLIRDMNLTQW